MLLAEPHSSPLMFLFPKPPDMSILPIIANRMREKDKPKLERHLDTAT